MTGLINKNSDTFRRRVTIFLSCMVVGLCGFGNYGQVLAKTVSIHPKSPANSINTISDATTKTKPTSIKIKNAPQYLPITARVKISGRIINLEVTRTVAEQSKGLMFRSTLPDNRGMLFNFMPAQAIGFWMKDVPVPLDMVFIFEGKVVAIVSGASPCKANPCKIYPENPVVTDQVIELRAGLADVLGLKLGDRISVESL